MSRLIFQVSPRLEPQPPQVDEDQAVNMRLDRYIISQYPEITRSQLNNRFVSALVNGNSAKLSTKVVNDDRIEVEISDPPSTEVLPEKIDLNILYQDEDTLVIDKPQGMVVHPGAGHFTGTLANALLGSGLLESNWVEQTLRENSENPDALNPVRPGIVHRLDKDTSGLILTARNREAHLYYSSLFKKKKIKKRYIAVVRGVLPEKEGEIISTLARDRNHRKKFEMTKGRGKEAHTLYRVLQENSRFSVVQLSPVTGRTHQLRVHMAGIGNPILGDPLYSRRDTHVPDASLMLHAWKLDFPAFKDQKKVRVRSQLPERFVSLIKELGFNADI